MEVVRLGRMANAMTRTMGVAFDGCTMPGESGPLFEVGQGLMGLGLGIHGEPGLADVPVVEAKELAQVLADRVLAERPAGVSRAAVVLNGLGATKYEELFVLWRSVSARLRGAGLEIVAPEVGELVTSLDMAGTSLTVMYLSSELEELWLAPALSPAFSRGAIESPRNGGTRPDEVVQPAVRATREGSAESQAAAVAVLGAFGAGVRVLREAEAELGRLDAVAGDGDHGRGMLRGVQAGAAAAENAVASRAGVGDVLDAAGAAWADRAGGTSGVLWGAAIQAAGAALGNDRPVKPDDVVRATRAFVDQLQALGQARLGDKTMLDSAFPFTEALEKGMNSGASAADSCRRAAAIARGAAQATAELSPRVGRARPLAAKSVGTPDPGAVSFAMIVAAVAEVWA